MSEAPQELEPLAEQLAARGREALLARLREAYAEAARAHADLISVDEGRLEELARRAVGQTDGLLWRRMLAGAASQELEIELSEALHHPAVARAQEMAGAPSYEESLDELRRGPEIEKREVEIDELGAAAGEASGEDELRLTAVHLGGVVDLKDSQPNVDLLLSEKGLDILLDRERILGRLAWDQIRSLDVPAPRGRGRRRTPTRLIVRTRQGDVSFEVPGCSAEELRTQLEPLATRFGPGLRSRP